MPGGGLQDCVNNVMSYFRRKVLVFGEDADYVSASVGSAEVQRIGLKDPPHFKMIHIKPDFHPRDDGLVLLTDLTTVVNDGALREWFSKELVPLDNALELLLNLGCIIG